MKKEDKLTLMGEEKMSKVLLKMGIPTMIGMMVSALYNIVDAYWVGRLGTIATAAVSVVYPLSSIGMMIGLLFGCGGNSVVARLLGQENDKEVKNYSSTAFYTASGVITVLISIMLFFIDDILVLLGTTSNCFMLAKEYAIIFIVGLFFNVFNMCMNNLIVAEGNSVISMLAMLIGGVVNLVLDPILILKLGFGVKGAAIATLISRMISSGIYLYYILRKESKLSINPKYMVLDQQHISEIVKIGLPIALFQLISGISGSIANNLAHPYGEDVQAAIGIVNRIMFLETNILYGFFKGYSPVVGYNFGAGKMERVKEATKIGLLWSTLVTIVSGIALIIFRKNVIFMFNKESAEVLSIGMFALTIYAISYVTYGYQIIIGNYFLAIGEAKRGGLLSLGKGLLYIVYLFLMEKLFGVTGIIVAQLATDVTGTLITALTYQGYVRNKEKNEQKVVMC